MSTEDYSNEDYFAFINYQNPDDYFFTKGEPREMTAQKIIPVENYPIQVVPEKEKPLIYFRFQYRVKGSPKGLRGYKKDLTKVRVETHVELHYHGEKYYGYAVKVPGDRFVKETGRRLAIADAIAIADAVGLFPRDRRREVWEAYEGRKGGKVSVSTTPVYDYSPADIETKFYAPLGEYVKAALAGFANSKTSTPEEKVLRILWILWPALVKFVQKEERK